MENSEKSLLFSGKKIRVVAEPAKIESWVWKVSFFRLKTGFFNVKNLFYR